jgi:hypothetical protein
MTALRIGFALVGFAVALLAVSSRDERVTWGAIALLLVSLIIRVLQRLPRDQQSDGGGEGE